MYYFVEINQLTIHLSKTERQMEKGKKGIKNRGEWRREERY